MYTLEVGGDQLVPVDEEEVECIVAHLEIAVAKKIRETFSMRSILAVAAIEKMVWPFCSDS
jgi:hypothetical protein